MIISTHIGHSKGVVSGMKNKLTSVILNTSKGVHLGQKADNDEALNRAIAEKEASTKSAGFLNDFEAIVQEETEKSTHCIALIKQDMQYYRVESQSLRKQLHSESLSTERNRIRDKIAANQQWLSECEAHIALINQRVSVLQQQLQAVSSQVAKEVL